MARSRRILLYVCLVIFLFILGLMVRRFYDNHFENKPLVNTGANAAPMKRVVEPAKELPAPLFKPVEQTQPAEKKDD